MRDYRVLQIPLDAAIGPENPKELIASGIEVSSIGIVRLPAAAADAVDLHFGQNGDPIPIIAALQSITRNPPQTDGVFFSVRVPSAGLKIAVLVGMGVTLDAENVGVLQAMLEELTAIRQALAPAP